MSPALNLEESPLQLTFNVVGTEVTAVATIGTIPKLLSYANKFAVNLEAQREGASRESRAFRTTRSPQPENALSNVANVMLHNTRLKLQEAEAGLSHVIKQAMSLELNNLRLVVFPRTMEDAELAHFVGVDVRARLDRLIRHCGLPLKRDLHLSFASMTISKFSQLNHALKSIASPTDMKPWLNLLLKDAQESIIVGLPSMHMRMASEEITDELTTSRRLLYDFHSKFIRSTRTQDPEDIYISLNMSLYSWLTVLKKNLSRELGQMKPPGEWSVAHARKRGTAVDLLQVPEGLKRDLTFSTPVLPATSKAAGIERIHSLSDLSTSNPSNDLELSSAKAPFATSTAEPGQSIIYQPRSRYIERLTMRQLGEATPDVMHPFFMKKSGFNLEESLPIYVNEYASIPLEKIMEGLLRVYSEQLRAA